VTPVVALTVAGSDSSGGAGVQADLKAFAACGVFGASAITALTAQNTTGVTGVWPVPADVVVQQVRAVLDDLEVRAVKTGMLATAEVVRAVAGLAAAGSLPALVVDPVMVASSGARLLEPDAEHAYVEALLPHARVLTPNVLEAQVLLGGGITTLAEQHEAARALARLGPDLVLVKGGHAVTGTGDDAVDVLWDGARTLELRGAAGARTQRPRHRLHARVGDRRRAREGRRARRRGARGQGVRGAGTARGGRLAARRRPRPARPLRVGALSVAEDGVERLRRWRDESAACRPPSAGSARGWRRPGRAAPSSGCR
jgi:hydroxymethylpyrimidine/phosphomethylpyrimidine kinase